MKKARHDAILSLIENENIGTQEALLERLLEEGFSVTQATISRDIKALRLIKTPTGDGEYKYVYVQKDTEDYSQKYYSILSHSVISVNFAGNIAVVKCYTGMAQAACTAVDNIVMDKIVGTLAGDDTIFVLCKDETAAAELKKRIEKIAGIQ
jgi:transcriptional regulator of arginine metabolism